MEKCWTIIDIINWGIAYFKKKNIAEERHNIELILSFVLNCERMYLYLNYDKPLSNNELKSIKELVLRKAKREPIQYIIGHTHFLNHTIKVNNSVLIPRPETELLVEYIFKNFEKNQELQILDIGTGSGCISIALGSYFANSSITSLDISAEAINLARINANENNINNIQFVQCDILKNIPTSKYDIIVSNPPYISLDEYKLCEPEVKLFEPQIALCDGGDGLIFYKRYNDIFNLILNENGKFFLEISYEQNTLIRNIFNCSYLFNIYNDFSNIPRYVVGQKKE